MSDLVFIYGPPAVGKWTVAQALRARSGWPLLHNHAVIDCVQQVFKCGEPGFLEACADVRLAMTRNALRGGKTLITTFVYAHPVDDAFVLALQQCIREAGGRWFAVELTCNRETLSTRIDAPHRAPMGKIADSGLLREVLSQYDCFASVPGGCQLRIDTDRCKPQDAAARIARALSLRT